MIERRVRLVLHGLRMAVSCFNNTPLNSGCSKPVPLGQNELVLSNALHLNKKDLPFGKSLLVRVVDYRWNHFVPSLRLLHAKLEKLGLAYINSEVIYVSDVKHGNV